MAQQPFVTHIGEDRAIPIPYVSGTTNTVGWGTSFVAKPLDELGAAITKTSGAGQIDNDGSGGFTINLLKADTSSRQPTVFSWEFRRTDVGLEAVIDSGLWTLLA